MYIYKQQQPISAKQDYQLPHPPLPLPHQQQHQHSNPPKTPLNRSKNNNMKANKSVRVATLNVHSILKDAQFKYPKKQAIEQAIKKL
jgi:hypothetical protein